ncbi:MAG: hypothetical protein P8X74_15320 [Reinekea sp.]
MISLQVDEPHYQMANQGTLSKQSRLQRYDYQTPLLNQWQYLVAAIKEKPLTHQWVTLINPPFIPNDQYLNDIGLGTHYIRIIRLSEQSPSIKKYIQRCLQNGKSALVVIWSTQAGQLPEILNDNNALSCQALVFSDHDPINTLQKQLEFGF